MADAGKNFGRAVSWTVSIVLLILGLAAVMGSASLLMPATNPVSVAAPRFQVSVLLGTMLGAFLLLVSEVLARRWSAPAGGWRWAWFLIGAFFLVLGMPLLFSGWSGESTLHRRTVGFRLGMGGIYVMFGFSSLRAAVAGVRGRR